MDRMEKYVELFKKNFSDPSQAKHKKLDIPGMGTGNTGKMLNLAVGLLEKNEYYLEIGTWRGNALIHALSEHKGKKAVVIDNFKEFDGSVQAFNENLNKFPVHKDNEVKLIVSDWREALDKLPEEPWKIGAYFYDGLHSYEHQIEAIYKVEPFLADNAIVFIDDTNAPMVRESLITIERMPGFKKIIDMRTPCNAHHSYWNGFSVFQYRKFVPSVIEWNKDMYNHPMSTDGKYIRTKMGKIKAVKGGKVEYWR